MTTEFMKNWAGYNFTQSVRKSGSYTLTTADERVVLTATGTLTLPQLSTLSTSGKASKLYFMLIEGASVTGTFSCNATDTINGSGTTIATSTDTAYIVLESDPANRDWRIVDTAPYLATANYQDGSVTTEKLADDAITNAKIGALAVDTAELAADAVTGAKIEDDAVDSEHIAAGAIDPEHFAALAVETAAINTSAVTTAKILDANVTGAKMSLTAQYGHVVKVTSSTDPQTYTSIPVAVTITNVTATSEDTTAANIVVKNGTDTVCTIAKGTLASGGSGAFTLANTALGAAGALTVESSVTNGDALVKVDFSATA